MPQYTPMVIRGRGGALPQYQQSGQHYAPGQAIGARIDDSSIAIRQRGAEAEANAASKLPEAIEKAGRTAGSIADQYGRIKALQAFRGYQEEMNWTLYNKDSGLLSTTRGESAFDVEKRIRDAQRRLHKKYLGDGVGSVFGIEMYFNQAAYDYDQRTYQQGVQHSATEYTRWVPQQLLASADEDIAEARLSSRDPAVVQKCLDRASAKTAAAMHRQGATPAEIGNALRKIRHDYALAVARDYCDQKDWPAAKGVLSGETAMGLGRGASNGGLTTLPGATKPLNLGTVSGRNLANNNFGNVKTTRGGWESYPTRHDGLMGVGERMLNYSDRRGKKSLWDILDTYCPDSEPNNDTVQYCLQIGKAVGALPKDASYSGGKADTPERRKMIEYLKSVPLNVHDERTLAGLIRAIPMSEHTAGTVAIGGDEAMAAAQDLLSGRKPRTGAPAKGTAPAGEGEELPGVAQGGNPLLTAGEKAQLWSRVQAGEAGERAAERKAAEEAAKARAIADQQTTLDSVRDWVASTSDWTIPEARLQTLGELVGELPLDQQDFAAKAVAALLQQEKDANDLAMGTAVGLAVDAIQSQKMSRAEASLWLEKAKASNGRPLDPQAQALALQRAFGDVRETEYTRRCVDEIKKGIDEKKIRDKGEIELQAYRNGLTTNEIHECENYLDAGGNEAGLTYTKCEAVWRSVAGKKGDMPAGLHAAAVSLLPKGKAPTEAEIRQAVCTALMEGTATETNSLGERRESWFGGQTLYEAMAAGDEAWFNWMPTVEDEEAAAIRWELQYLDGVAPGDITDWMVRYYKKRHLDRYPGRSKKG